VQAADCVVNSAEPALYDYVVSCIKETFNSENERASPQIRNSGFGINVISLIAFLGGGRETSVCTVDSPHSREVL
jgi:hypothetical protein